MDIILITKDDVVTIKDVTKVLVPASEKITMSSNQFKLEIKEYEWI